MNRNLAVLAIVLVVQLAGAGLLYVDQRDSGRELPGTALADIDTSTADRIVIADGESTITLARENEAWNLPEENGVPADDSRIDALFRRIEEMSPGFPVARQENSQAQLKVAPDDFERHLTLYDGDEITVSLYLGTSSGLRESHIRLADENDIFATRLNSYQLPVRRGEWLNKWLLSVEEPDRIEGDGFILSRNGDKWQIESDAAPVEAALNEENVTELVEAFQDLAVLDIGEPETPDVLDWKPFTVTSGGQEFRFHFASEDKTGYVRRDGVDFIFRINEGIYETVNTASTSTLRATEKERKNNGSQTSQEGGESTPAADLSG